MKKKILALVLAMTMVICMMPSAHAYSVRDAYDEFAAQYPEFIDVIVENGVSESKLIDFLRALQRSLYLKNLMEPITEDNFEDVLLDSVESVSNADRFLDLQRALMIAYPDAVDEALVHRRIHPDLMPLCNTVKSMIFEHDMLSSIDTGAGSDILNIVSIDELDGVSVEKGKSLRLPSKVDGRTETGVAVPLDITWDSVPDTSAEGTFTAEGTLQIPEGYRLDGSLSDAVSVEVVVTPANTNTGDDKKPDTGDNKPNNDDNKRPDTDNTGYGDDGQDEEPVKHVYSFSDVSVNSDLGKAVYALSDIGVINGYVDGTFKPDNPITRAEIAKIMTTAMGSLDAEAAASFTDTKDHWALLYVASAQKAGLINGYPDGTFKPDNNITRAEVMTIVYRALDGKKAFTGNQAAPYKFSDDALVPDYAKTPIGTLANYGIVSGTSVAQPDGSVLNNIDPTSRATRGQCVLMVYNALKLMGKIK